jgi:hypothetical protein
MVEMLLQQDASPWTVVDVPDYPDATIQGAIFRAAAERLREGNLMPSCTYYCGFLYD